MRPDDIRKARLDRALSLIHIWNWPYFEPYFGFSNAQEWIRTTFETIEKSRNVIMHSGVLDELDVARVGMNIIDWLHQINA